jgi:enterochelin esterase-like enzyme
MKRWLLSAVVTASSALSAAEVDAQNVRRITVESKILGETRNVRIALPANYALAKQAYPVIYLLDGQVQGFFDITLAAARYGIQGDVRDYAIPPHIVVAVEHKNRGTDLGRNGESFIRFLAEELVPHVSKNFRAGPFRILVGHSLGGRFALMAGCRAPGFFPAIVAVSPGGGDSTAHRATTSCLRADWEASGGKSRHVFVSSGEREARIDEGAKRLRDFLRDAAPPNVRWKYLDGPGLAHTETPYFGIPAGIKFIHDRLAWEMPASLADSVMQGKENPSALLSRWYTTLSARNGFTVPVSAKWLDAAISGHLARRDAATATQVARQLIEQYPEELMGYGRLADIFLSAQDTKGATSAIRDALRLADRLEFFDETERALKKKVFQDALDRIEGRP